jgi:hypothetical protein
MADVELQDTRIYCCRTFSSDFDGGWGGVSVSDAAEPLGLPGVTNCLGVLDAEASNGFGADEDVIWEEGSAVLSKDPGLQQVSHRCVKVSNVNREDVKVVMMESTC